jgi:hypothetical protein
LLLLLLLLLLPLLIDIVSKSSVVDPTLLVHLALRHDLVDNRMTKFEPQRLQNLGKIFGMHNSLRWLSFASRGHGTKSVKHGQSDCILFVAHAGTSRVQDCFAGVVPKNAAAAAVFK